MSTTTYYLLAILIMTAVTYMTRVLPLTLFTKQINSKFIKSFLYYVPYAVLASLTFPAIFSCCENTVAAIIGTIVALILAFCEKGLALVAAASALSIFIINLL